MSARGSVLLVDDETKILNALASAVRADGHDVVAVTNPREAQRLLGQRLFDVLVVDNLMPELSGFDLHPRAERDEQRRRAAADRDHDRARHRRERDRGDAPRRLRLPAEAVRDRRAAGRDQPRARPPAAAHRAHLPDSRTRRRLQQLRHGRPQPADAGTEQDGGAGRAHEEHGADHRRDGNRQGAGGAGHPLPQLAARDAADQGELRGDSRSAARIGAVRPRARRVHRRDHEQEGQVRAGRWRHHLPRRDRHDERRPAGEAAARAAGARVRAARVRAHAESRRSASSPPPIAICARWSPTAGSRRISTTG